jgi:hypothetical protein
MGDDLRAEIKRVLEEAMTEIKPRSQWEADYEAQHAKFRAEMKRENRKIAIVVCSILVVFLTGFGALLWFGIKHQNAVYDHFLAGCLQDHNEYECMAIWRAGDSSPPVVLPILIPTGK